MLSGTGFSLRPAMSRTAMPIALRLIQGGFGWANAFMSVPESSSFFQASRKAFCASPVITGIFRCAFWKARSTPNPMESSTNAPSISGCAAMTVAITLSAFAWSHMP